MTAEYTTHYVLDVVILVLAIIRYLWGSPLDLTRLGIVLCFLSLAVGNFDFYYKIFSPQFAPGPPAARITGKLLLFIGLMADLMRDYLLERRRHILTNWAERRNG